MSEIKTNNTSSQNKTLTFKDKEKPTEVRLSNIIAARGK
jgi:hypothetical protein